ncbi:MAG: ABC transporter permease subunit [Gemmatimonadaceae bacterium]
MKRGSEAAYARPVSRGRTHAHRWDTVRGLGAALLVAAPVLLGVAYSVAGAVGLTGVGARGFSLERAHHVLGERIVWQSIAFTLWYAAAATGLATAAAVTVAALFRRGDRAGRVAHWLAIAPLPVPYVVAAAVGLLILGQSGFIARALYALRLSASPADMAPLVYDGRGVGLIVTLAWKEFPFLALVAFSLLSTRAAALEEAARTLGASAWQTFARVTLPLLWRGLLPAITAVFIFVVGSYEASALLGPSDPIAFPVLTLERYDALDLSQRADAYVLGLIGMVVALIAIVLHEWTRARAERLRG